MYDLQKAANIMMEAAKDEARSSENRQTRDGWFKRFRNRLEKEAGCGRADANALMKGIK